MTTADQTCKYFLKPLITTILLSNLIAGCSNVPEKPTDEHLQIARNAIQEAQNNPLVAKYAANELAKAKQLLTQAETTTTEEELERLTSQAQQQAQQAIAIARQKATKAEPVPPPRPEVVQACEEANTRRLEDLLKELKNRQTERGWVLLLEKDIFKPGKADLLPVAIRHLNKVATFLKHNPNRKATIEGHTENVGDRNFTLGLSQRRAEEVRFTLVKCGIASNRVMAKGLGGTLPVTSRSRQSTGGEPQRVEIIILNEGRDF
jgi:outer membrane protein OmpA-like peptidoglycan-associated protein